MAQPNAHTETDGGPGHGGFPPFQSETFASQIAWLLLSFAILYVVMAKVALPRIGQVLDARRNRIAGDLGTAKRLKDESEAAQADYQKALADARNRAQALANETREKQAAEADSHRKTLESELHARLAAAEQAIGATKTAAMANVQGIATDAAAAIVTRLIGVTPASATVEAAVADALKR